MSARLISTIVTFFALAQLVLGIALIFLPEEIAGLLFADADAPSVLLSLIGAALFGFGQLNWMMRQQPIGGIYGRPVLMANLVHFVVGGLALAKAAATPGLWGAAAFYLAGAVFYGLLLFKSPTREG